MISTLRSAKTLIPYHCTDVLWTQIIRFSHNCTEVKIPMPWGHIAGKWWNKDDSKPLVAVHGWLDNANSFDCLVPLMRSKLPVLAIDLPGHGQSSHYPRGFPYHRSSIVVALRRIVEYYGWENVSLMGHSFGGQICFLYAAMYPEEVDALVSLDILAPFPLNENQFVKNAGAMVDDFLRRDNFTMETASSYPFNELVKLLIKSRVSPLSKETAELLLARGTTRDEAGNFKLNRDPRWKGRPLSGWSSEEITCLCRTLKTNVLCLKAESSPYFSTKEFFEECWADITKVAKHADLRYLPGSHHFHVENAEIISTIVNDFLVQYTR